MKIGILTLPLHTNYGGILQAYALQAYLKGRGHDAWIIDISRRQSYCIKIIRQIIRSAIKPSVVDLNKGISSFIDKHIDPRTRYINIGNRIFELEKYGFEAYVVGSDQVWREEYCREWKKRFFLDFVNEKSIKRIAYAASFGIDTWTYDEKLTLELSILAKKFDLVSVREDSAIELCKDKLGIDSIKLLDPTMLLRVSDYEHLIPQHDNRLMPHQLMTYILDDSPEKQIIIEKISGKLSYKHFPINIDSQYKFSFLTFQKYTSVVGWLKAFSDAKYIVTDSFHGCVFSIIFNKPFIAIGNSERGLTRFNSLLKMFGLENRLIENYSDISDALIYSKIDWCNINKLIAIYRSEVDAFFQKIEL